MKNWSDRPSAANGPATNVDGPESAFVVGFGKASHWLPNFLNAATLPSKLLKLLLFTLTPGRLNRAVIGPVFSIDQGIETVIVKD
jgi:hypothetical protein